MTSLKNFLAKTMTLIGAVILAPFIALFGLIVLGLTFGLSLMAVGAMAALAKQSEREDAPSTVAEPQPAV